MVQRADLKYHKFEKNKEHSTTEANESVEPEEPEENEAEGPAEKENDDGNKEISAAEDEEGEINEADQDDADNEVLAEGEAAENEVFAEGEDDKEAKEETEEDAGVAEVREVNIAKETPGRKRKRKRDPIQEHRESQLAGLICLCSADTKMDCFKYHVFGFPEAKKAVVEKVKKGMKLFLFDIEKKVLYGIYKASSEGGMGLEPQAFRKSLRKFPVQVRFRIHKDCVPLQENEFKHAIKENYFSVNKFKSELTSEQVGLLMQLFRPLPPLLHSPEGQQNARSFPQTHIEDNLRRDQQAIDLREYSSGPPRIQRLPRESAGGSVDFGTYSPGFMATLAEQHLAYAEEELRVAKQRYEEAQAEVDEARRAANLEDRRANRPRQYYDPARNYRDETSTCGGNLWQNRRRF